ncbi:M23 family metallopeptidase [Geovibrio thiophilus]|uniref:M23 family metallopeptidase n=2 Tax=Geovibrio thiophilus TaxID=139438 RepID=A0A3R5UZS7_9BACT|nr:M23 family metallopeptidase [Geovibrio thiophilus]
MIVFAVLFDFAVDRVHFLQWKDENKRLTKQIKLYEPVIAALEHKSAVLDSTQNRLMGTASLAGLQISDPQPEGGAESSQPYQIAEDIYQTNALNPMTDFLGKELDSRIKSITGLANFIEEQEYLFQSTPSGSPVEGWISSKFDFRLSPFTGRIVFHEGLDIAASFGSPVRASAKGIVIFSGYKPGYGNLVTIDHGYGFVTRYGHNSRLTVKEGDFVQRGERIALVGSTGHSTGPHVHYEVLINGIPVNPLNFMFNTSKPTQKEINTKYVKNEYN